MPLTQKKLGVLSAVALAIVIALVAVPHSPRRPEPLPASYSDEEFWRLVNDFSEPGGFFRSDNFVSNETAFQRVIPELRRRIKPGGIYIGVGPDQNFSYMVALRPRVGFIVDIRRQNMLEHLLYKSVIELSEDRVRFLSRLFSRPLGSDIAASATAEELLAAVEHAPSSEALFETNYREVVDHLTANHHFVPDSEDLNIIRYVYRAFLTAGPEIRYSFPTQGGWRKFPTYSDLMVETDGRGVNHSYIASEENFQALRQMQLENRVVPIVGDFAGDKALRRLGGYLAAHGTPVTAFYTSNVEFYLFQNEDWRKFFDNVGSIPMDRDSVFIRAYFDSHAARFPAASTVLQSVTLLDNMTDLIRAVRQGRVRSYEELVERSW